MKFLFYPAPAHGHVTPMLPLAQELVSRGDEVVFYLSDEFEAMVRSTGASFRRLPEELDIAAGFYKVQAGNQSSPNFKRMMLMMLEVMVQGLNEAPRLAEQAREERADCIVYDPMCCWGRVLPSMLRLPAVLFHTTYAMTANSPLRRQMMKSSKVLPTPRALLALARMLWAARRLHRRYGVPRLSLTDLHIGASEELNLVPVPRRFQPDADYYDERTLFVGPSVQPRNDGGDFPLEQLDGKPVLLVSLGTTSMNVRPDFYKACFEAFRDTRWQVVMACGEYLEPSTLGEVPSNFLVRQRVPQLDVLRRARVFLTHGGMNSTMEGLYHGVPLLVFPQMGDQSTNASRVTELGLGLPLSPSEALEPKALREAVERLDTEPDYRARLTEFQSALQEAGGHLRAADALQRYVAARSCP